MQKSKAFLYTNNEIQKQKSGGKKPICYGNKENKLHFLDYAITIVLNFTLCPPAPSNPLPQAMPPPLFMPMGHAYKFFGYSIFYTVLYIQWLFCNYLFVLLNSLTSSPIPQYPPPIWQPSKCSQYP